MDVIKITPEELRITAVKLRDEAEFLLAPLPFGPESEPGVGVAEGVAKMAESWRSVSEKFSKLADKLDADKLDAMTFCAAKVEGVQA